MSNGNEFKINKTSWLWHRRLEHASMNSISKLIKKDLVKSLPKLNSEKIEFIMHANLENKPKPHLNLKELFLPLGHWNYSTWISLDLQELQVLEVRDMA